LAWICGFRSPLRHLAESKRQYQGPVACAALRSHISHSLLRSSLVRLPERPPPERPAGSGVSLAAHHTLRTDPARPPPRLQAPPRPVLVRLNPAPAPAQRTPPRQRLRQASAPAAQAVTPGDRPLPHRSPATAGDRQPLPPSPPQLPSLPSAPWAAAVQLAAATATAGHVRSSVRGCRILPSPPTGLMLPHAATISPATAAVAPAANLGRDTATPATDLCARSFVVPLFAVAAPASRCVPARHPHHRRRGLPPRVGAPPPPPPRRRGCPAGTTGAADTRKAAWGPSLWWAGAAGEGKAPLRRWSGESRRLRGPWRLRRASRCAAAAAVDSLSNVRRSQLTQSSPPSSRPPLRESTATLPLPPRTAAVLPRTAILLRHRPAHRCRGRRSVPFPPQPPPSVARCVYGGGLQFFQLWRRWGRPAAAPSPRRFPRPRPLSS